MRNRQVRTTLHALALGSVTLGLACGGTAQPTSSVSGDLLCSISTSEIFSGGPPKDGIPALSDPATVSVGDPGADYLIPQERVIGIVTDSGAIAIPLQIMWWHEIVNLEVDGLRLAVTHCPLTGSSLAFDREPLGGVEFGVSGLLYRNNLIMYDRDTEESLWPQMSRGARCGNRDGVDLTMVPVFEMTWGAWTQLHPDTRVLSSQTGYDRNYGLYPYGDYDDIDNRRLLFPISIDARRPPKERVLGVPGGSGGVAYPFGELDLAGPVAVVEHFPTSFPVAESVVFWDAAGQAGMLFDRTLDSTELTFEVVGDVILDQETGSEWRVDGLAIAGTHAGRRLEPVAEAYVAFWFAWAAFEPGTDIWEAP